MFNLYNVHKTNKALNRNISYIWFDTELSTTHRCKSCPNPTFMKFDYKRQKSVGVGNKTGAAKQKQNNNNPNQTGKQ